MSLPKAKTPLVTDLASNTILLYGSPKIGKSTWCAKAENAIFLATEAGLNHVECFQWSSNKDGSNPGVKSWENLLLACKELAGGKHEFKTVVIDTIDNAYLMCQEHVCKEVLEIAHPSDAGYGKGFTMVNNEFHRVLTKLSQLPYGLILVSHARTIEEETRTGTATRTQPTLPGKAREIVLGLSDIILFAELATGKNKDKETVEQRVIRTKPNPRYEAGDRTGRLPPTVLLDWPRFLAAFNAETKKEA